VAGGNVTGFGAGGGFPEAGPPPVSGGWLRSPIVGVMTAVFAEGWDDGLVGPITRAVAAGRDAAGEPYTVVFVLDGRRHAVLDVSWGDGYCGLERFDPAGRRISRHELRRSADGDLFLREARTWVARRARACTSSRMSHTGT